MEGPRNKEKKAQPTGKQKEPTGESETEEYIEEKDNSPIQNILLQKKRYYPKKEEKHKRPILKKESSRHIKIENKRNTEIENPKKHHDLTQFGQMKENLEVRILLLEKQNSLFKKQFEEQKKQSEEQKNKIDDQDKKIKEQKKQIEELKEKDSQILQEQQENCKSLEKKLMLLKSQVKELSEFHFQVKLRKLLKNLIQYLFRKYYPDCMIFNKRTKKMEFDKAPLLSYGLLLLGGDKIIHALNRLLDILFNGAKKNDYIVHFVEPKAENDPSFRRYIKVFDNQGDFFKYFHINESDTNILIQIIPMQYFMEIDNFQFDKSIKELMNNYENNYFW